MLPWTHLELFLGLICGAQIEANCYRGRVLSFSSSLFLIQASAGKVMEIKHRQSHSLPSAFLLPHCLQTHIEYPCDLRQLANLSKPQFAQLKMGIKKYLSYRISVPGT